MTAHIILIALIIYLYLYALIIYLYLYAIVNKQKQIDEYIVKQKQIDEYKVNQKQIDEDKIEDKIKNILYKLRLKEATEALKKINNKFYNR
jgi:hypothetical protein